MAGGWWRLTLGRSSSPVRGLWWPMMDGRGTVGARGSDVEASDVKDADVVCIRAIEK